MKRIILMMVLISTIFLVGCDSMKEYDKSCLTNKAIDYCNSIESNFNFDKRSHLWGNGNTDSHFHCFVGDGRTKVKDEQFNLLYDEIESCRIINCYNGCHKTNEMKYNHNSCKTTYIEHLIKVDSNVSFELTKCKESGLIIDVNRIEHELGR